MSRRGAAAVAALASLVLAQCSRHGAADRVVPGELARALRAGETARRGPEAVPPASLTVVHATSPLRDASGLACHERRLLVAQPVADRLTRLAADGSEEPVPLPPGLQGPEDLAIDEAGTLFVSAAASGAVWRRDPDGTWRSIASDLPGATGIALDPDGRLFVGTCVVDDALYEVDPQGARPPRTIARDLGCPGAMVADGPGSLVVPLRASGEVVRIRTDLGVRETLASALATPTAVGRAPDGSLVVLEAATGDVRPLSAAGGAVPPLVRLAPGLAGFVTCGETALASSFLTGEVTAFRPWPSGARALTRSGLVVPRGLAFTGDDLLVADGVSLKRLAGGAAEVLAATVIDPIPPPYALDVVPGGRAWITVPHLGEVHEVDLVARRSRKVAGGLDWPTSIVALPGGGALVTDTGAGRLVRVEPDGSTYAIASGLVSPVGLALRGTQALTLEPEGGRVIAVHGDAAPTVVAYGLAGPAGIAADARGNLYVAETRTGSLVRIAPDGERRRVAEGFAFGTLGAQPEPIAIAAAPDGSVVVASPVDGGVVRVAW